MLWGASLLRGLPSRLRGGSSSGRGGATGPSSPSSCPTPSTAPGGSAGRGGRRDGEEWHPILTLKKKQDEGAQSDYNWNDHNAFHCAWTYTWPRRWEILLKSRKTSPVKSILQVGQKLFLSYRVNQPLPVSYRPMGTYVIPWNGESIPPIPPRGRAPELTSSNSCCWSMPRPPDPPPNRLCS